MLIVNGVKVSEADMVRFWKEQPDTDFSVARNEAVIANSIKRAEELRAKKIKEKHLGLQERASALASYIKYLDKGGSKTAEDYFGRKIMAELRGKQVMQMLKGRTEAGLPIWEVGSTQEKLGGYR